MDFAMLPEKKVNFKEADNCKSTISSSCAQCLKHRSDPEHTAITTSSDFPIALQSIDAISTFVGSHLIHRARPTCCDMLN